MITNRTHRTTEFFLPNVDHAFRSVTWVAEDTRTPCRNPSMLLGATSTFGMGIIRDASEVISTAVVVIDAMTGLAAVATAPVCSFPGIKTTYDVMNTIMETGTVMLYISQVPLPSHDIDPEHFVVKHPMAWTVCKVDFVGEADR